MKIAIITASIGNGHNAVAHALSEALQENLSNEVVRLLILLKFIK